MRTICFLLTFLLGLLLTSGAYAYGATIKDNKSNTTGYFDSQGNKVYKVDKQGRRRSYISSDGAIKDKYGKTSGYMKQDGDRTYYTDKKGRRSGSYIESDGTIKDKYGRKTGSVKLR